MPSRLYPSNNSCMSAMRIEPPTSLQQVGGGPVEPSRDVSRDGIPLMRRMREVVGVAERDRHSDERADQQRGANEGGDEESGDPIYVNSIEQRQGLSSNAKTSTHRRMPHVFFFIVGALSLASKWAS